MSDERNKAFDQALSNFTFGMASKDVICHMADEGYSVKQIHEACDYPTPIAKVAETVWEHYIETGVILEHEPGTYQGPNYDYVMDFGKYGKRSFRRVKTDPSSGTKENTGDDYIPCDIGIIKSEDQEKYAAYLSVLDSRMRDYIDGLPWPPARVWHISNLRIREITAIWSDHFHR